MRSIFRRSIVSFHRKPDGKASFSSLRQEPSLEQLTSMLSSPGSRVLEVVSDEIVKIPVSDGISVGSEVSFSAPSGEVRGVVIQYNNKGATVALTEGNRGSLTASCPFSFDKNSSKTFQIKRVPFATKRLESLAPEKRMVSTKIPAVDMLLKEQLKQGSTVAIYSHSFKPGNVSFPSVESSTSAMAMYLDLIARANEALKKSQEESVTFVCDFRRFSDACRSLEFQAGCSLPTNPQSLVASVLQLAHTNDNGNSLSVIAIFGDRSDFGFEAGRSVDIGIDVSGEGHAENIKELLSRFSLKKSAGTLHDQLIRRIVDGMRLSHEVKERQTMGIFVDDWEQEERECIASLIKLLPVSGKVFAQTKTLGEERVLVRALTTLFFNKTSKRHSAAIERFPSQLLDVFSSEETELVDQLSQPGEPNSDLIQTLDHALMRHRYRFELTNPLVAL